MAHRDPTRAERAAVPALLALAMVFAVGILTTPWLRFYYQNSDLLFPAALWDDIVHHPGRAGWFQMPRIPSLFPDLLLYGLASAVAPSWRIAWFCYAAVSFASAVLLFGAVASRLARSALAPAMALVLGLGVLGMLLDNLANHARGGLHYVLYPVIHSGSLIAAFGTFLLVRSFNQGPTAPKAALLFGLVALCTLSDRIFVGTCALPAAAGTLAMLLPAAKAGDRRVGAGPAGAAIALIGAGCAAGLAFDWAVFEHFLFRDPNFPVDLAVQQQRIPALLADPGMQVTAACALLVVVLPCAWLLRSHEGRFWWVVMGSTAVGAAVLLPLVYEDVSATRYAQQLWWWAVVAVAAAGLRLSRRALPLGAVACAGAACVAFAVRDDSAFDPLHLARWRHPVEACLADLRRTDRITAGIGGYWTARTVGASSDWTLPVLQVTPKGRAFFWQNNRAGYSGPPGGGQAGFDFAVMASLEPEAIKARYGAPSRVVPCGGTEVWLYAPPVPLQDMPGASAWARRDGLLDAPTWFSPADLSTRAGPLAASGAVPPTGLPAPSLATWGPYASLRPGPWRLALAYSLASGDGQPAGWDVTIGPRHDTVARGPLEPGQAMTKLIEFSVRPGQPSMEIRTVTKNGDRLHLHGLRLCPAGLPADQCTPGRDGP